VSSGHRCMEYNQQIGGAERSQHLHGRAADILVADPCSIRTATGSASTTRSCTSTPAVATLRAGTRGARDEPKPHPVVIAVRLNRIQWPSTIKPCRSTSR
jgi:hypothetical protein